MANYNLLMVQQYPVKYAGEEAEEILLKNFEKIVELN